MKHLNFKNSLKDSSEELESGNPLFNKEAKEVKGSSQEVEQGELWRYQK